MWWEDHFNLCDHGDPYEKLWWPLLQLELPQYQGFWKRHIVPLTNRIDPETNMDENKRIAFRDDPNIDADVVQTAMAQYSTFYFFPGPA